MGLLTKIKLRHRVLPVALNQVAALAFGILSTALFSRFVAPELFGIYSVYFVTLTQLGFLLTHCHLINHSSRYWQREAQNSGPYVRFLWSQTWRETRWLLPLLSFFVAVLWVIDRDPQWFAVLVLLFLTNAALVLHAVITMILNADGRYWALLATGVIASLTRAVLPVGVLLLVGGGFLALSGGFALHAVLTTGCLLLLVRPLFQHGTPGPVQAGRWHEELRQYGRPFIWMGVGSWLLLHADRWIVLQFFGEHQAGLFGLAANLALYPSNIVSTALMQLVFPGVFRAADHARSPGEWRAIADRCDRFTWLFLGGSITALLGLTWLGPHLVGTIIGEQYRDAMPLLFPAGMAMTSVIVNQFQYLVLQGQHNSSGMVRVMLTVAAVKTVGSLVAALISWEAFLGWLSISLLVSTLVGRQLIRRIALQSNSTP